MYVITETGITMKNNVSTTINISNVSQKGFILLMAIPKGNNIDVTIKLKNITLIP